jgi:hypothetical protein
MGGDSWSNNALAEQIVQMYHPLVSSVLIDRQQLGDLMHSHLGQGIHRQGI